MDDRPLLVVVSPVHERIRPSALREPLALVVHLSDQGERTTRADLEDELLVSSALRVAELDGHLLGLLVGTNADLRLRAVRAAQLPDPSEASPHHERGVSSESVREGQFATIAVVGSCNEEFHALSTPYSLFWTNLRPT